MVEETKTNLRELPKPKTDVRECLKHALSQADGLTAVFIIAESNDGPWIRSSTMTGLMKCYLSQFFQAWVNRWLQHGMEDIDVD